MKKDIIFWNVDTQVDFVEPEGKLYVPGAELLKPVWKKLTILAEKEKIKVVNSVDFHTKVAGELSVNPDFITTFPEHCMANTKGAEHIKETEPLNALVFDWDEEYNISEDILLHRNIIIRKNQFDVFTGNSCTEDVLKLLNPEIVLVYGVTTNVCVDNAVVGLAGRVKNVYVVEDAIRELPNIPLPFENWKKLGVRLIKFQDVKSLINLSGD